MSWDVNASLLPALMGQIRQKWLFWERRCRHTDRIFQFADIGLFFAHPRFHCLQDDC